MAVTGGNLSFLTALTIARGDVVCLTGAGGKTSLMFRLAEEAVADGLRVLVTTTTRILVPEPEHNFRLDLTGEMFATAPITAGVYVGGRHDRLEGKILAPAAHLLEQSCQRFDLVLIEADGAARKQLKGWNESEPVIPPYTTATIGVVDISTVGQTVTEQMVHRIDRFTTLTGAGPGSVITTEHLKKILNNPDGLFKNGRGQRIVYLNKVEDPVARKYARLLRDDLQHTDLQIVAGSIHSGIVLVSSQV